MDKLKRQGKAVQVPMTKKQEIEGKYFQLCAQLGEIYFRSELMKEELENKLVEVETLNTEYNEVLKNEASETSPREATIPAANAGSDGSGVPGVSGEPAIPSNG